MAVTPWNDSGYGLCQFVLVICRFVLMVRQDGVSFVMLLRRFVLVICRFVALPF